MPADNPEVYYRRNIFVPFLDELVSHLKTCFSDLQEKAIMGMTLFPSVMVNTTLSASTVAA